jgi:hypothetical protein
MQHGNIAIPTQPVRQRLHNDEYKFVSIKIRTYRDSRCATTVGIRIVDQRSQFGVVVAIVCNIVGHCCPLNHNKKPTQFHNLFCLTNTTKQQQHIRETETRKRRAAIAMRADSTTTRRCHSLRIAIAVWNMVYDSDQRVRRKQTQNRICIVTV